MSFDILQGTLRWLPVILTAQANGIDPVTDAAYDDLVVKYRKEGDTSATTKVMTTNDWVVLDSGVYKIKFSVAELNTLETFLYSVELAPVNFCTDFVPYYGAVEVVTATVTTIDGKVDTLQTDVTAIDGKVDTLQTDVTAIDGKVDTIDGVVDNIYVDTQALLGITTNTLTVVSTLHNEEVAAGAYYDGSTLSTSLVLHRNGGVVQSPTSATLEVYDQSGTLLTIASGTSPDARGVFTFSESLSLTDGTVPYIKGTINDASGAHASVVLAPVIGIIS